MRNVSTGLPGQVQLRPLSPERSLRKRLTKLYRPDHGRRELVNRVATATSSEKSAQTTSFPVALSKSVASRMFFDGVTAIAMFVFEYRKASENAARLSIALPVPFFTAIFICVSIGYRSHSNALSDRITAHTSGTHRAGDSFGPDRYTWSPLCTTSQYARVFLTGISRPAARTSRSIAVRVSSAWRDFLLPLSCRRQGREFCRPCAQSRNGAK